MVMVTSDLDYFCTSYRCFIQNLALIGLGVSVEQVFEFYGNIRAYCPGVGQTNLGGQTGVHFILFRIINFLSIWPITESFSLQMKL